MYNAWCSMDAMPDDSDCAADSDDDETYAPREFPLAQLGDALAFCGVSSTLLMADYKD